MNNNLKPCPFCGLPPHMDKHRIFCDCGVEMEFPLQEWGCSDKNPEGFPTYEQAKEVAVERWNEREYEPVRHGKWIEIEESATGHLMECSVCKEWILHNFNYVSNYCPNCGAKMRGDYGASE